MRAEPVISTGSLPLTRSRWEWLGGLVLVGLAAFMLFWRLGTYPAWFDSVVGFALWPQVNHVLDGAPLDMVTWRWEDMYQHNAGLSPVYSALQVPSLRSFGLTLLAVRLPLAVVSLGALATVYFGIRSLTSWRLAAVTVALVSTSSWYLILARSGGILALGIDVVGFLFGILVLLALGEGRWRGSRTWRRMGWIGAIIAGLLVSLLPYAHVSTRLVALIAALMVPAMSRVFSLRIRIAFLVGLLPLVMLQLRDPGHAAWVYLEARGEGLWHMAGEMTDRQLSSKLGYVMTKVATNLDLMAHFFLGLNEWPEFFSANEASSYWHSQIVLYPKILVPFFVTGLAVCLSRAWNGSKKVRLFLGYFLLTLAPGILAGDGFPNAARLNLAIVPIYIFIAVGLLQAGDAILRRWPGRLGALVVLVAFGAILAGQAHNYFAYPKGDLDDRRRDLELHGVWQDYRQAHPDAVLVVHEFSDFYIESYVTVRWRGGARFADELAKGTTILAKRENLERIQACLTPGAEVYLITRNPPEAVARYESLGFLSVETREDVAVFRWQAPPSK